MERFIGIRTVLSVALGGALAYGIVQGARLLSPWTVTPGSTQMIDYTDFVSIMLTGVSILLTAFGFVVALMAFIGWNAIRGQVSSIATGLFHDSLKEGGEIRKMIREVAMHRDMNPVANEADEKE